MVRGWRAIPTMLRIGLAEAVAYRAEMVVWVLSTTMPLIMLVVWTSIAEVAPVQGLQGTWSSKRFVAYFLSVFIVRQLISAWAAWQINFEVRQGILSMRLLRPIHPVVSYLVENLAYLPQRLVVTIPIAIIILVSGGAAHLSHRPLSWVAWLFALVGGWLVSFFANCAIGALCLYLDSSVKIMDVWLAGFFVFSGYLFPVDLFPPWLRVISEWLPFRSQIGLPVELMTGALDDGEILTLLARQWGWAAFFIGLTFFLWNRGIRRFQAFGG